MTTTTGDRPYVLLSCAMSVDGYIDDSTDVRLLLSNDDDFDRVDEIRAGVDAILIGAATVRADNPRLFIRSLERRAARSARGLPELPFKVTITRSGDLDPEGKFFAIGDVEKLVYCPSGAVERVSKQLGQVATVIGAGDPFDLDLMLADMKARGIERLMVEGGGEIHTMFLASGCVDELQLAVAPFFVGDAIAPRFVNEGQLPKDRMQISSVDQIGDVVVITYHPAPAPA